MFNTLSQFGLSDIHLKSDPESNLKAIIAIHNTSLGPAVGGCRFMQYRSSEEALTDAASLAQCMSYKAALAKIPAGGGKAVIIQPREPYDRARLFHSFADFVESLKGRYVTALDCGSTLEDMDIIASHTRHVSSSSKIGDCSKPTALGIFKGMKAVLTLRFGHSDFKGIRVAIQGLGHVGMSLAWHLHGAGAKLIVSDLDAKLTAIARRRFEARIVTVEEIYSQPCEIFSPCGLGGTVNEATIEQLHCAIIAGAANNQLASDHYAQALHRKDVLYIPDFAINSGGLIYAAMKYKNASEAEIISRIAQIPETISELLKVSAARHTTPWQSAMSIAEDRLKIAADKGHSSTRQTAPVMDIIMAS